MATSRKKAGILVEEEDIEYVLTHWLSSAYLSDEAIVDETQFNERIKSEGLNLTLKEFSKSDFYKHGLQQYITEREFTHNDLVTKLSNTAFAHIDPFGPVERPHNGLGHTLRSIAYIPYLVKFMQKNATDNQSLCGLERK